MAHSDHAIHTTHPSHRCALLMVWPAALLLALLAALWLTPGTAQAGTITIVDGPNTPPTLGGVYTDGYINAQLAASSLTITTTGVITGPNEIRVLQDAVITWTVGTTLTLDAGSSVIISGTIQHDGPANGNGGVTLLTSGSANGKVILLGAGDHTEGVAVGSRFGLTRVQAGNLVLTGGASEPLTYAQLGFHGLDQPEPYTVTGPISVTVSQNVTATGGGSESYVQIGHGGMYPGNFGGHIAVAAGGDVTFQAGNDSAAYALLGNGGSNANGSHSGDHSLHAGGDVTFQGAGNSAYAQFGNGGYVRGNQSGNHTLIVGGNVLFQGGNDSAAYAQFGNGGFEADGSHTGNHTLAAGGDVNFQGGSDGGAYSQLGNGGAQVEGSHSGDHSLSAEGDVTFGGGASQGYAQLGNGGYSADGNQSGSHDLTAGGDVNFAGGDQSAYAQLGNGGFAADGNQSGSHSLEAGDDVNFAGGGQIAYAQLGNGGVFATGSDSGSLTLSTTGGLTMTRGSGADAYAMIGHGADTSSNQGGGGSRAGDIEVRVGETAVFSGSQVGHVAVSDLITVTQGLTYLGVSQNDPTFTGSGQLLVTGPISSNFSSAPAAAGGQLRVYLPRATSQLIPISTGFNGAYFATDNVIPPARIRGHFPFGAGPYSAPYSFYLGLAPDVAIGKSAVPAGPLDVGQLVTYTLSFSNSGTITASGVVVEDVLPGALSFTSATLQPDAGMSITQTGNAPNLAWSVSELPPGKGGRIHMVTQVQNVGLVQATTFTNTATISATVDSDTSNNRASVARSFASQVGEVTGLVYVDTNGNAQPEGGEGLEGVTVTLQSETGVAAGLLTDLTDVTDNHGEYGFADVPAGDYTLRFAVPTGFESIGDAPVTVTPGQTITVPDQVTVRVLPHKVYVPVLRDLNPEPPTQ